MNWALYAMERIIKRETDKQESTKKLRAQLLNLEMDSFQCNVAEKKLVLAQQIRELCSQLKADCEAGDARSYLGFEEKMALRCMMVLSASCHFDNGSMRTLSVDGIGLASMLLDMPIEADLLGASIGTIQNTLASIESKAIVLRDIYDPLHLVTRLLGGINKFISLQDFSKTGT